MEFDVVVEIPKGSRNKYEWDPAKKRFRLDRMLFTATEFPSDYGFLPGTLAEDGEPVDALVLVEEPTFTGCVIRVRPVALFRMQDEEGPDPKVICVPATDPREQGIRDMDDVPEFLRAEISHFFEVYKELEPGKQSEVGGWQDRAEAEQVVEDARRRAAGAVGSDTNRQGS
jgi:inorganic pyrophosphatase